MKNKDLAVVINFFNSFVGGSDSEYGFRLEPISDDSTVQALSVGNGKSRFTAFEADDRSGIVIGYQNDGCEIDYRFMVKFDNTDSIDSMIKALTEARGILTLKESESKR